MNKLEFPPPKDDLCHVWLKLALWFWRRRYFNIFNRILHFGHYLPLEMGVALCLNKLEFLSPKDALCQVWLKLVLWFWRRSWKCKSLLVDRQMTDNRQSEKLTWAFYSYIQENKSILLPKCYNESFSWFLYNLFLCTSSDCDIRFLTLLNHIYFT